MRKCTDVILEYREVMRYLFKALFSKKIHKIDNKDFSVSYQKCSNFKNKDVQYIQAIFWNYFQEIRSLDGHMRSHKQN